MKSLFCVLLLVLFSAPAKAYDPQSAAKAALALALSAPAQAEPNEAAALKEQVAALRAEVAALKTAKGACSCVPGTGSCDGCQTGDKSCTCLTQMTASLPGKPPGAMTNSEASAYLLRTGLSPVSRDGGVTWFLDDQPRQVPVYQTYYAPQQAYSFGGRGCSSGGCH